MVPGPMPFSGPPGYPSGVPPPGKALRASTAALLLGVLAALRSCALTCLVIQAFPIYLACRLPDRSQVYHRACCLGLARPCSDPLLKLLLPISFLGLQVRLCGRLAMAPGSVLL